MTTMSIDQLFAENEDLRRRLDEAEETIRAIRAGEVDAVLVESEHEQVFTLEQADKPYQLLVEQLPQAAATLTNDGKIISCNRHFANLLRRPAHSLLGNRIHAYVTPESRPILKALLRDGQSGDAQAVVVLDQGDGASTPVYFGASVLREGARGQCLMLTDLTEQRHYLELQRAQAALRDSEARLEQELADINQIQQISSQLIQQDRPDALYRQILDSAAAIMRSDFASMQMLDAERGELRLLAHRGFSPEAAKFWEWVRPESGSTCAMALRTGQRVIASDVEMVDLMAGTDDLKFYRQTGIRAVQTTPLTSRDGRVLGMISTHWRDPHEPTERQLRMFDVLARLAADVIERRQTEEELRKADRRKDEFLATLAHELRNPLAPIRNAVHILKSSEPSHPELDWARGVLDRQVEMMSRLLEDLLDVSRISRNKLEPRKERVELTYIIEAALETSQPVIEASGHKLMVTLPSEPIYLQADPARLAQVFANLLNNAAKYTENGGEIRLTAIRQGAEVVVSVKDSGIGIAADMLPIIFEMFSQEKPALARSQGGLGIGLSLVKTLVELHGGSIEARSDGPHQGSEFIVRLPIELQTPTRASTPPSNDGEKRPARNFRILIVDDNRDSADSLTTLLKLMGNEAQAAYDGEQALEAAARMQPDVVLLDIGMPKLNGYDACRRIREQPWGQKMVLIALTGWGQEKDRRRAQEAGFDQHLVKPVNPDALMKLLASCSAERKGSSRVQS